MPEQQTIAIFAATNGRAAYFADIVRLAGYIPGKDGAILALADENAPIPADFNFPILRIGGKVGEKGVRVIEGATKAGILIASIRSAIQAGRESPAKIRIGEGELDTRDYLWTKGPETLRLTEKETAILSYLNAAAGKPVGREDLLRHVWSYVPEVETHTLETHIYRLRQKIEDDPSSPKILITQGDGYALTK